MIAYLVSNKNIKFGLIWCYIFKVMNFLILRDFFEIFLNLFGFNFLIYFDLKITFLKFCMLTWQLMRRSILMIFYSMDSSWSFFPKSLNSLISYLNSLSDLIEFEEKLQKYLNSLWIRPLFTIILLNT